MSPYRSFDKNNCMYFMISLKFSNIIKRKFNCELVYNKKYIKAENKINTKESFQCIYIPVILIDSVYRKDENYYPIVFLEKYHSF